MFKHTDKDGAPLSISAAENHRVGKQVFVKIGTAAEAYVDPSRAGEAAAAFLECAGVEVGSSNELDWHTSAESHEERALAHLRAAAEVRRQEEIRKARHALADAVRKEFPETDPYDGVEWDVMTHKGQSLHLNRLGRIIKVLNAQDDISIPDPWGKTDEPPRTLQHGDPEPDQDIHWKTPAGRHAYYDAHWWWLRNADGSAYDRTQKIMEFNPEHFPMKEEK